MTKRIVVNDCDGNPTARWFDPDKARSWEEGSYFDGRNHVSTATGSQWEHEMLYRTASGAYIINHWSQWQGSGETYHVVSPAEAAAWLLRAEQKVPEDLMIYVNESEL